MARGGYQKPSNPAAVSGPGALSQRTDGQPMRALPDAKYGENKDYQSIQGGAPMASTSSTSPGGTATASAPVVPLDAPSQQPGTPVTDGAALGPGAGPEAMGWQQQASASTVALATKYLPYLMRRSSDPDTSPQFRALVSYLQNVATPANPNG